MRDANYKRSKNIRTVRDLFGKRSNELFEEGKLNTFLKFHSNAIVAVNIINIKRFGSKLFVVVKLD